MCKAGEVVSFLWDKATKGAGCLYREALKVYFALETLNKKHLYVSRTCPRCRGAARRRGRLSVDGFLEPTGNVKTVVGRPSLKPVSWSSSVTDVWTPGGAVVLWCGRWACVRVEEKKVMETQQRLCWVFHAREENRFASLHLICF